MIATSRENDSPLLIAFAGGGTGGHLFPSLAVAEELRTLLPAVRFLFLGSERLIDARIVQGVDCELLPQPIAKLTKAPWRWPTAWRRFRQSALLCRERFEQNQPAVVIGTGGMASVAPFREARRMGIPTAILNPDARPGRANRFLASHADAVFVQWQQAAGNFPKGAKVEVVGCPVRAAFRTANRLRGLKKFGLVSDRLTLLVTGASLGARSLNKAMLANLEFLEQQDSWQVLHLTGEPDYECVRDGYAVRGIKAVVEPFTDEMPDAMAAADLVVSRAGASTLAEITCAGKPSVLFPYPYHRDMHQRANACCLVERGAAEMIEDGVDPKINGPRLLAVLKRLMVADGERLAMAQRAKQMGRGSAAKDVAQRVLELIAARSPLPAIDSLKQTESVAR